MNRESYIVQTARDVLSFDEFAVRIRKEAR